MNIIGKKVFFVRSKKSFSVSSELFHMIRIHFVNGKLKHRLVPTFTTLNSNEQFPFYSKQNRQPDIWEFCGYEQLTRIIL